MAMEPIATLDGNNFRRSLTDCICIHPTLSEGLKAAAGTHKPVEIPMAAGRLA